MRREALLLALGCTLLSSGCRRQPVAVPEPAAPAFTAEIVSQPQGADVQFKDQEMGKAPLVLQFHALEDLLQVQAALDGIDPIERRIRFLDADRIQLLFRFGAEPSAMLKALGLNRVLIFDTSANVSFDTDQYALKPEFVTILQSQADILERYFPALDVFVCGHTDSTGGDQHNLELSLKRAQAVTDQLASLGLDRNRLKTHGFGEVYPIEDNSTPEGRAGNRRTELVLPQ